MLAPLQNRPRPMSLWRAGRSRNASIQGLSVGLALLAVASCGSQSSRMMLGARPQLPPTAIPQRRTDRISEIAHSELLEKARIGVIDVYFVGDSITRRWGALDYPELLANWNENFFGWNAADFAWGGDRTQNILWRLQNGELAGVEPKIFVIQAGTNNLGDMTSDAAQIESIYAGIKAIVEACRSHAPNAVIVLTGLFPRSDVPLFRPVIDSVNERLAAYADGQVIRYVDINDRLSGADGLLLDTMSDDGLHLSLAAYQIWADALKPIFAQILGPPANRDQAPPPTGNPAVR